MKVLRWILFFPAAFLAAFIGSLLFRTIDKISFLRYFLADDSLVYKIFDYPIAGITFGFLFIFVGTLIAPSKKNAVSLILLITVCLASIMSSWQIIVRSESKDYMLIVFAIFMLLSSIVTYLNIDSLIEEDSY